MEWRVSKPDKNGVVRTPGIETGKVEWWYSRPNLGYLEAGGIIVLKFMGGMSWSGRGETRYNATSFLVLRIKRIQDDPYYLFVCEEVVEFPVRKVK